MGGYFLLPYNVFDLNLSRPELIVYCYMFKTIQGGTNRISYSDISRACSISRSTAIKAIKLLEDKKLINKIGRVEEECGGCDVNEYTIFDTSKLPIIYRQDVK